MLLTAIGIAGLVLISFTFYRSVKNIKVIQLFSSNKQVTFVFISNILTLIFIGCADFYDRYIIQILPGILFLLLSTYQNKPIIRNNFLQWVSVSLIILISLFTLYETHNYFSWNRCRWEAIDYMTQELKINPDKIDGGFEFNAWNFYDPNYKINNDKSWWWVQDDEYLLAFGVISGYNVFKSLSYNTFLSSKKIYILKRES